MFRDLGDFQTPKPLVKAIFACLLRQGRTWERMLEPTCGQGNFIAVAQTLETPLREIIGVEIQENHAAAARAMPQRAPAIRTTILRANVFDVRFSKDLEWEGSGPLLVVGNPPWVTNSELSALGSANLPRKTNLKNLPGLEAMTGSANFDITEYIWIKLLRELADEQPTIALLCKSATARNILRFAATTRLPISNASIHHIDAKHWFNASVDACLFMIDICKPADSYEAQIFQDLESVAPISTIVVIDGKLVSNPGCDTVLARLDGRSPLTWRQGLKHDAASVVELTLDRDGSLWNKLGEVVKIESDYVYPLLKSSDLGGKRTTRPQRRIIVPQKRLGENTAQLAHLAPQLWSYLISHRDMFDKRRSAIYQRQPSFAYFGLGEYSFAPYKVAISGMYKTPRFRAVGPTQGKPAMLDDTCYFLPCSSSRQAALLVSLLNDPLCLDFLDSITFWDSKRPITKGLLQRVDLLALLREVDQHSLLQRATLELEQLGEGTYSETQWPESLEEVLLNDSLPKLPQLTQPVLWSSIA